MKIKLLTLFSLLLLFSCGDQNSSTKNTQTAEIQETDTTKEEGDLDFLAFAEEFPILEELSISGEMIDQLQFTDYQKIAAIDVIQYLYQLEAEAYNKEIKEYKGLPCKGVEDPETRRVLCHLPKEMIESDSIEFYYYGQLPVSDQVKSLIFFFKDHREETMPKGIYFLLFNYNLNGKFIS
jgi:hypothetical protein